MFYWLLVLVSWSVCSSEDLPDITDRGFIESCLREHNRARSSVVPAATDMRFMSWDAALAAVAHSWAKRCVFQHSPPSSEHPEFSSLGENLWVEAPPSSFSVTKAVQGWVSEMENYSYDRNHCKPGQMCGHYTQVVWSRSYKVGCAVHLCSSGITFFHPQPGANFVCNYGPAGNIIGRRPYQTNGAKCSQCEPEDSCVDRLCRNKARDGEESHSWVAMETESSASDLVPVLVIRPVAALGSVVAAVAVKRFYPDIFFYE